MIKNISKGGGAMRVISGLLVIFGGIWLLWFFESGEGILGPAIRTSIGILMLLTGGFMIFEGMNCW